MHISLVRSRTMVMSALAAAAVGLLGCDVADSVTRDLSQTMSRVSFTAQVDSGATRAITDTVVTQDTIFLSRTDTILAPPDTVILTVTDTLVNGTDTVLVQRSDTLVVFDTIFVPGRTDTVVTVDTVVVVQQVPVVPNLATSASSLNLTVGQSVQLGATLENALGQQATSSNIAWRSFNAEVASVTGTGRVSAISAGQVDLQARDTVLRLFQELPVTVSPAGMTQPVTVALGGGPNEPAFFVPLVERTFSATSEAGWWGPILFSSPGFQIVQDVTAPTGGNGLVGRMTYPTGYNTGGPPGSTGFTFITPVREVYGAFWFKASSNWQGHDSGINKVAFFADASFGGGGDPMFINLRSQGSTGNMFLHVQQQGPLGSLNKNPNVGSHSITRGVWYYVEIVLRMNTGPDNQDGQVHMWVNGNKQLEYSDMHWSNRDRTWTGFKWEPTWGGIGGTNVQATQHQFMDYVYLSGR